MSEYSELLKNPFWQKKRNAILERDNYTCQNCNDEFTNLQVHHTYYTNGKMPWEYPDEALVTLCELCHEKEGLLKWLSDNISSLMLRDGFIRLDIIGVFTVIRMRVKLNNHAESVRRYMSDIKLLLHG